MLPEGLIWTSELAAFYCTFPHSAYCAHFCRKNCTKYRWTFCTEMRVKHHPKAYHFNCTRTKNAQYYYWSWRTCWWTFRRARNILRRARRAGHASAGRRRRRWTWWRVTRTARRRCRSTWRPWSCSSPAAADVLRCRSPPSTPPPRCSPSLPRAPTRTVNHTDTGNSEKNQPL